VVKLEVEDGDVVVVKTTRPVPPEVVERVQAKVLAVLNPRFPNVRVLVMDETVSLQLLKKGEAQVTKLREALAAEKVEPSGGHDEADEVLGLLRVARMNRDAAEEGWRGARARLDEMRKLLADLAHLTHRTEQLTLKGGEKVTTHARDCAGCKTMGEDEWVERLERALGRRS
jgi:hypothetical protein